MDGFEHERLDVYRARIERVAGADQLADRFPRGRAYLSDQLRRAVASIPLNIAEAPGSSLRRTRRASTAWRAARRPRPQPSLTFWPCSGSPMRNAWWLCEPSSCGSRRCSRRGVRLAAPARPQDARPEVPPAASALRLRGGLPLRRAQARRRDRRRRPRRRGVGRTGCEAHDDPRAPWRPRGSPRKRTTEPGDPARGDSPVHMPPLPRGIPSFSSPSPSPTETSRASAPSR